MTKLFAEPGGYDRVDVSEQVAAQAVDLLTLRGQLAAAEKKIVALREERDRASEQARKSYDEARDDRAVVAKLRSFGCEVEVGPRDGQISKKTLKVVVARMLDPRHEGSVAQPNSWCYCDSCRSANVTDGKKESPSMSIGGGYPGHYPYHPGRGTR